jgi:hypothetical protein
LVEHNRLKGNDADNIIIRRNGYPPQGGEAPIRHLIVTVGRKVTFKVPKSFGTLSGIDKKSEIVISTLIVLLSCLWQASSWEKEGTPSKCLNGFLSCMISFGNFICIELVIISTIISWLIQPIRLEI